jgi:uncharacterized protein YlxW (UPF0749 family)
VNEIAQAVLLLSGPAGAAVVWWFKRRDDAKLRARVDECERDRASLNANVSALRTELTEQRGAVRTLTALLKREINID